MIPHDCRALDTGAGEGVDSVRLAKMGFDVESWELAASGAQKINMLAIDQHVSDRVYARTADIQTQYISPTAFDIILNHGVLDYLTKNGKRIAMEKLTRAIRP